MYNKVSKFTTISIILLLLLSLCSCKTNEIDVHIFSDMEECQEIKGLESDNIDLEIYDSPVEDKYLKKLEFQEFFGCKYSSDDLTFELFAYVFSNIENAMEYFENGTGVSSDLNPNFISSAGISSYSRIVVSENKAYVVYCKKADKENVINFLNSCFSVDIIDDLKE